MSDVTQDSSERGSLGDIFILGSGNHEKITISNMVHEINIYEDVHANTVSGNMVVVDPINMISKLPILGYEKLIINLKSSQVRSLEFFIYKVGNRENIIAGATSYMLYFISKEAIVNTRSVVKTSFKGTYSKMVGEVFRTLNSPKKITIQEDFSNSVFLAPSWKPFKLINAFCQKSVSKNNRTDFFFFENLYSGFKFVSLRDNCENRAMRVFNYNPMNAKKVTDGDAIDMSNIREFEVLKNFDSLEQTLVAGVSSSMLTHDIIKKTVVRTTHSADVGNAFIPRIDALNQNPRTAFSSTEMLGFENSGLFGEGTYNNPAKWKHRRAEDLSRLNNVKIRLTVMGDTSLEAGSPIKVNIPIGVSGTEKVLDENLSGKYVIMSLRHFITRSAHMTSIEASKL